MNGRGQDRRRYLHPARGGGGGALGRAQSSGPALVNNRDNHSGLGHGGDGHADSNNLVGIRDVYPVSTSALADNAHDAALASASAVDSRRTTPIAIAISPSAYDPMPLVGKGGPPLSRATSSESEGQERHLHRSRPGPTRPSRDAQDGHGPLLSPISPSSTSSSFPPRPRYNSPALSGPVLSTRPISGIRARTQPPIKPKPLRRTSPSPISTNPTLPLPPLPPTPGLSLPRSRVASKEPVQLPLHRRLLFPTLSPDQPLPLIVEGNSHEIAALNERYVVFILWV